MIRFVDGNNCAVNRKIIGYCNLLSFQAENFFICLCTAWNSSQKDEVKMCRVLVISVPCVLYFGGPLNAYLHLTVALAGRMNGTNQDLCFIWTCRWFKTVLKTAFWLLTLTKKSPRSKDKGLFKTLAVNTTFHTRWRFLLLPCHTRLSLTAFEENRSQNTLCWVYQCFRFPCQAYSSEWSGCVLVRFVEYWSYSKAQFVIVYHQYSRPVFKIWNIKWLEFQIQL